MAINVSTLRPAPAEFTAPPSPLVGGGLRLQQRGEGGHSMVSYGLLVSLVLLRQAPLYF